MRILQVSKFATVVGGVETHLHDVVAGLRERGHDVEIFSAEDLPRQKFSAEAQGVRDRMASASALLWNRSARTALADVVARTRPDVVHLHSVYHQLSPSVFAAIPQDLPIVMTLHDYKLAAPCYLLTRNGRECTLCVGRTIPIPGIRYRCVADSRAASALCAVEAVTHRSIYRSRVTQFIVPSQAAAEIARRAGLPSAKLRVVPWGVEYLEHVEIPQRRMTFVGRLSREKGLDVLLDAWDRAGLGAAGWELTVIGTGRDERMLRLRAAADPSISPLGWVERGRATALTASSTALICPSLSPETFGLTVAEALAAGVPVVGSRIGALPELLTPERGGLLFEPGDANGLAQHLRALAVPDVARRLRVAARSGSRSIRTIEVMVEDILQTYRDACG